MKRDGSNESAWQHQLDDYLPAADQPTEEVYDVLIAGAGMTGITTGLLLQKAGLKCLIVESNTIAFGTSAGTSAHLNSFFETPFNQVSKDFGETNAQLLAAGAAEALALIRKNIADHSVDCDFEERSAYVFSLDEKQDKELEDIVAGCKRLHLPMDWVNDSPFPIPYHKLALITNQAQFHPVKYIFAMAKAFEEAGGMIKDRTRVTDVHREGEYLQVKTSAGTFMTRRLVWATHVPPGVNLLHFRTAPYRSYVMAFELADNNYPDALGYDMDDPYRYYRSHIINGKKYLIAGGEDHKTGHSENTEEPFRKLESYVRSYYEVSKVAFKWSSQYFEPADGLAYIGHLPGNDDAVYAATGYGGNGMIYSHIAALLFHDLFVKGESKYSHLFDPDRLKPVAGFSHFIKENADVVKEWIKGKFSSEKISELADLAAGEAKLVKYEGHHIALYKDEQHNVHAVNPSCTHIHCTVAWNATEKSWDCPCHGARYDADGEVITGPAVEDLERLKM